MSPHVGLLEARIKRPLAALLALTVTAGLLFAAAAAVRPSSAQAFAWKDQCTLFIFNRTGEQTNVRPILYTPLLPNPASIAEYAAFAALGIPTSGSAAFTNTGYPFSDGCRTFMNFSNPGPTVSCKVEAPTEGANTFSCEGNATARIIQDDDDIAGNVFIPSGSGDSPPAPAEPKTGPTAIDAAALPAGGWQQTTDITRFGLAGTLMDAGTLPADCTSRGAEPTPKVVSPEEVVSDSGLAGLGTLLSTFDNSADATTDVTEALSANSIDCLSRLLSSGAPKTRVAVRSLATPGKRSEGKRLVISQDDDGSYLPLDYVDVVGQVQGAQSAIDLVQSDGVPPTATAEDKELSAVTFGG
jgi:hypothetical protein